MGDGATLVLVPARMASTRLPGKPLAPIGGVPMIVHVWRRAVAAGIGPVVVACAEPEIARAVEAAGGRAELVLDDLPSGTDRIFKALQTIDPLGHHRTVVNLQGDLPALDPQALRQVIEPLERLGTDMATLAAATLDPVERAAASVVKAVIACDPDDPRFGRALYFTRAPAPWGDGPVWHHIGLYAFRRAALERFCGLPASPLERREKLEQLRALEAGMSIGVRIVDTVPLGVDTPADLEAVRSIMAGGGDGSAAVGAGETDGGRP